MELQAGDVVFFAAKEPPTEDITDTTDFAQLAGLVQSWPYGGNWERPWYHVGVMLGSNAIGHFELSPPNVSNSNVWAGPFEEGSPFVEGRQLTVLRCIDATTATKIAAATHDLVGHTDYASLGLVAFAIATEARCHRFGELRDDLTAFAQKTEALARAHADAVHQHTCVSAAYAAISAAGISISLDEPPAPPTLLSLFANHRSIIQELMKRHVHTVNAPMLEDAHDVIPARPTAMQQMGAHPVIGEEDRLTAAEYVRGLLSVVATLMPSKPNTARALMDTVPPLDTTGCSWTASPAMLYDALLETGNFTVAGTMLIP